MTPKWHQLNGIVCAFSSHNSIWLKFNIQISRRVKTRSFTFDSLRSRPAAGDDCSLLVKIAKLVLFVGCCVPFTRDDGEACFFLLDPTVSRSSLYVWILLEDLMIHILMVHHFCLMTCSIRPRRRRSLLFPLPYRQPVVLVCLYHVRGPGTDRIDVRWKYGTAGTVIVMVVIRAEASWGQRRLNAGRR